MKTETLSIQITYQRAILMLIRTETSVRLDPTWQFAFSSAWLAPAVNPHVMRRFHDIGDVSLRISLEIQIPIMLCNFLSEIIPYFVTATTIAFVIVALIKLETNLKMYMQVTRYLLRRYIWKNKQRINM